VRFVISARAEADLFSIHSYYLKRSPAAAERIITRFFHRFDELCDFPFLGPDRSELRASLRGLLADGYIIFYTVEESAIVIVRVLDGRMNVEQEFSE
jgi:toxin ParE1/3/4